MTPETIPPTLPAAIPPNPASFKQSSTKAGKVSLFTIAGALAAGFLCGKVGQVCNMAGGNEVIAATITGLLYGGWDYVYRKGRQILQK